MTMCSARGGRKPKRKGDDAEREFARLVGGRRVPLSGSAGGDWAGDVEWPGVGRGEIKRRKDGFKQLYKWLGNKDFLAVRADKRGWLVILRLEEVMELTGGDRNASAQT